MTRHIIKDDTSTLGFWFYLMTDLMLFSTLFASFMVLRRSVADGPAASEIFDMRIVLVETTVLLASSMFCGLAWLAYRHDKRSDFFAYLLATLACGSIFLGVELAELTMMVSEGNNWQTSAFLSSYFVLVGTHGAHIAIGLLWGAILGLVAFRRGLTPQLLGKFGLFSIFWHFLDIVWIFIFTIVYVIGGGS